MSIYSIQLPPKITYGKNKPLTLAFLLALTVHTLLIAGVDFGVLSSPTRDPVVSLNITLLEKPGGNPDASPVAVPQPPPVSSAVEPPVNTPKSDSTRADSTQVAVPISKPAPSPQKTPASTKPVTAKQSTPVRKIRSSDSPTTSKTKPSPLKASELRKQALQIARMEIAPQIQRGTARTKYINPNAMTTLESFYLNAWRRKVEKVGTLNFPEEARRLSVVAGPTLDVALRADGTVQDIRLVRSSGHESLDKAAQRIVELAAPYAPFPEELRQQYDILHIVRKWKFEHGQLSGR